MNNSSLEKEIKEYSELNKQAIVTISKLAEFFKSFGQQGKKFAKNSQNSLDDFYQELVKENTSSTFYEVYYYFYDNFKSYLKIFEESFDAFDKKLGRSIEDFETKFKNNYGEAINQINNLLNTIKEKKEKLENSKYKYFESCNSFLDIENKIIQLKDNKSIPEEEEIKLNEQLSKVFKSMDNNEKLYKKEIKEINKIYEDNEENYSNIIKMLRNINIEKIRFYAKILKNIYLCTNQFIINQNKPIVKIDKIYDNIKVNRDIILYDEKFNYYNDNKKRFIFEQFLDFKKFKKNYSLENKNSNISEKNNNNSKFDIFLGFFRGASSSSVESNNSEKDGSNPEEIIKNDLRHKVLNLGKNNDNFIEADDEAKADSLFIKYLLTNKDKMADRDFNILVDKLKKKESNLIRFMSVLITFYKENQIIKIENLENFSYLANILDSVLNICIDNKKLFDIYYMIIFVAEKTLYINRGNSCIKQYLYKIISKNNVFQRSDFWQQLIIEKIEMKTDKNVKKEIEKKEKEKQDDISNYIVTGIKSYFVTNKAKENQKLENEIFSRQLYEEKSLIYAVEILKEYIQHFFNFNIDHKKSLDLIAELSKKYKFDNKYANLFLIQLNSNIIPKKKWKSPVNEGEKELDYNKLFFYTDHKKFKKIIDNKMRSIIYSLKFIEIKELPNLLCLNKTYNDSLQKIIYKNILIKYSDMDLKTHIYIWKIILGYSKTKKQYNYKKIVEEMKKNPKLISSNEIIRQDVNRTTFEKDKELNREKIVRILNGLSICVPDIHYSQGMNFIAAFLLNICKDEEEAFYIFLCLLLTSDYGSLFTKDFANLKKYFYFFERIINILLPDLYNYLKLNKIKVNFFASSWFITLFTDTYINIKNRENPKVLLKIWDLFLFKGFKSILKVGISLLKTFEYKIMSLSFEELLRFLITDIPKSEFFQNSSYDNLMKSFLNIKIENELINNIEKEYQIKITLEKDKI